MISLCFNGLAVAAMRTDLEMRGTGRSEETSKEAIGKIKAGHNKCLCQGDSAGDGENGQMLDMFLKIELTGFVDELDAG